MKLSSTQYISIGGFGLLFLVLLLGFSTKPKSVLTKEHQRKLNLQSTNVETLKSEAIQELSSMARTRIQLLEAEIRDSQTDSTRIERYKQLAKIWYDEGRVAIAGSYAEEIAMLVDDAEAWGIAGTTYAIGINTSTKEKERQFCLEKALAALENASSIAPDVVSYQLNRAIILTEHPPEDNPMRGVLMLLDLNKKHPKNVAIINNIAKFALQTGQLDKAEQRLLKANDLSPNNNTTICLFAKLYKAKGDISKAEFYEAKCDL